MPSLRIAPWCLLALAIAPPTFAQGLSRHAYLPLDHWSMPFLEHLVAGGAVRDPTPLIRPWTVGAISDAIAAADPSRLNARERSVLARVRRLLTPVRNEVQLAVEVQAAARSATHSRRDPLREAGPGHTYPAGGVHLALEFGPAVLVTNPVIDPRVLRWDPDYAGRRDEFLAARFASAYVAYRTPYLEAEFGAVDRNWGPPGIDGVLVSPQPYSYDHVFLQLGPRPVRLQVLVAQLEERRNANGDLARRYWVVHRLAARPTRALSVAAWQGTLFSGPGRSLEFWFLNPLKFSNQVGDEERVRANNVIGLDVDVQLARGPRLTASFFLDDLQVIGRSTNDEPPSYAFTLAATQAMGSGVWSALYSQVSNLVYRTPDPAEALIRRNVGLARNFSDYDQASLNARWMVGPGLLLGPEFTLLRQGEGDFRLPFPPEELNSSTPTLFAGTVEHTWRGAIHANVLLPMNLVVDLDAAVHRIENFEHQADESRTHFVGSFALRYRFGKSWRLRN